MQVKFTKYDPAVDAAPHLVAIEVPYKTKKQTVLETIQFAHEISPVHFDYSCHGRRCGRCAVMLDGEPVLACVKVLTDGPHTIEPLPGLPILRDLIVDKTAAQDDLTRRYLRVRAQPLTAAERNAWPKEGTTPKVLDLEWCARCLVCTSACPVHQQSPAEYIGPAAMLAVAYRNYDPYDQGSRPAEAVQGGLWNCIMCGRCDDVCPQKEIHRVSQIWPDLRAAATAAGFPEPTKPSK